MKRFTTLLAFTVACGLGVSAAFAGPGCGSKRSCDKVKADAASCSSKAECQTACNSNEFPKLVRMVGDKAISCPVTAAKMAKDAGSKVVYLVADKRYDDEGKAMAALADASEAFVTRYASVACVVDGKVTYCSMDCTDGKACDSNCGSKATKVAKISDKGCCSSDKAKEAAAGCCSSGDKAKTVKADDQKAGDCSKRCDDAKKAKVVKRAGCCQEGLKKVTYRVAGRDFKGLEEAEKASERAKAAIKMVHMSYVVDGKKVDCESKVCPKAKAAGKVKYCVGDTETGCQASARIALAKAQYDAARKACDKLVASR